MRIKLINILIRKIKIFWDNLYGLDFHTTVKTNNLNLDPDKFYDCSPSASFAIKKLFNSIGFTNKDSFLDIGCGKGSVLRLLLKYPLNKIEGIEISESIYNICSKNLKILNDKRLKATCIDARFFENYDKFNFLYAYNPCNEIIFEEIINYRLKGTAIGFNSKLDLEPKKTVGASLKKLENQDLLKFGMIPEFIGRLPVITTLSELDEDMLIRIMTQPKNAIVKQFESLMKMDGVKLEIKEDALKEIAKLAVSQNTGARGLRSIIEDSLMDLMYKVPDQKDLYKVVINKDVIAKKTDPILIYSNKEDSQKLMTNNS